MSNTKTVWITGAHGFIGRHLASHLAIRGHRVFGIGHGVWPETDASRWGIDGWVNGEIDGSNLESLYSKSDKPDWLFHLAGGSTVGNSIANPLEDYSRTVSTTARLLDWIRLHAQSCRVIAVSSAAVYGSGHCDYIPESAISMPYSPYGYHKLMMEQLCNSYTENFGLHTIIIRLFSVYGPWMKKQLLWDLCSRIEAGSGTIRLGGTGDERRDWANVEDIARLLELAASDLDDQVRLINGGCGVPISVKQFADMVVRAWQAESEIVFTGDKRPGDPFSLVSDNSLISSYGFRCKVDLESGVDSYVNWYKRYRSQPLDV